MWGMLKQRERIRTTLQRVPPDVSVSLRDGCAFVSDQRSSNSVRNASILEQANRGVVNKCKDKFEYLAFSCRPMPRELADPWLTGCGGSKNSGNCLEKHCPHVRPLRMDDFRRTEDGRVSEVYRQSARKVDARAAVRANGITSL